VLSENSDAATASIEGRHDEFMARREFGMGVGESFEHVEPRPKGMAEFGQPEHLACEILLGTSDLTGDAPQQIDRDLDGFGIDGPGHRGASITASR
jgi:hypothetical protein